MADTVDAHLSDNTSWAKRTTSTGKVVIKPRTSHSKKRSAAEKASQTLATSQKKAKKEHLSRDIKIYMEQQGDKIEEISRTHGIQASKIKAMITSSSNMKESRAPSLHNAILFDIRKRINEGAPQFSSLFI